MTKFANAVLAATLMAPLAPAQQTPPSPQAPQKIEAPCDPKQTNELQKRAETRTRRLFSGVFNKLNKEVQKKTEGTAPVVTPDDLAKQVQTPCKAPAVVTPPPIRQ